MVFFPFYLILNLLAILSHIPICYARLIYFKTIKEDQMKNKLSSILAITSILTMGGVNAENWSPWNNNYNYNPFSGNNNSISPWNFNNNTRPFNFGGNTQPFGFNTNSNSFGPFNNKNMQPFNGGYNWQDQNFNPVEAAKTAGNKVQEVVESVTNDKTATVTPELFMQMVQVTEVDEGITGTEVDESIKSMATNESILHVAMFPLSEQIKNVTGKPYRHLSIHNICDAATAGKIADIDDRYAVILPCRIAVVEGKDGKIRMISMNPDVMNAMNLPEDALGPAMDVAEKMNNILEGAKEGSF